MRHLSFLVVGLAAWQIIAPVKTVDSYASPDDEHSVTPVKGGVIGTNAVANSATYSPLTASVRWRGYFINAYGPKAIVRAAADTGVRQWNNTPREWGQGSEAYGERFGSHLAEHVIRETLQSGAAAILHEDDRYFASGDTGFGRRLMHAVSSVFVARNNAGQEHFAY